MKEIRIGLINTFVGKVYTFVNATLGGSAADWSSNVSGKLQVCCSLFFGRNNESPFGDRMTRADEGAGPTLTGTR